MLWFALPLQCEGGPPQAYQEMKFPMQVVLKRVYSVRHSVLLCFTEWHQKRF